MVKVRTGLGGAMDKRSKMMWRAAGYFITAVTTGGWVTVLAY